MEREVSCEEGRGGGVLWRGRCTDETVHSWLHFNGFLTHLCACVSLFKCSVVFQDSWMVQVVIQLWAGGIPSF